MPWRSPQFDRDPARWQYHVRVDQLRQAAFGDIVRKACPNRGRKLAIVDQGMIGIGKEGKPAAHSRSFEVSHAQCVQPAIVIV